ncbi:MAG TPA: hypothetical protein VGR56_07170 [Nitrososphaerales archaeon]|nr:hypothetical protein [Nitrososphaerales archaeon]
MSELLHAMVESAERMEKTGVVDESILPIIDKLAAYFKDLEDSWVRDTTRRSREVFYPYYAAKNAESMLEKMKSRYISSLKTHTNNPGVAADTIKLVPFFVDLYDVLLRARKQLDEGTRKDLLLRARKLRNKASETEFLPSMEDELRGLDMKEFARKTQKLAEIMSREV